MLSRSFACSAQLAASACVFTASAFAHAEIGYRVTVRPEDKKTTVEMDIPAKAGNLDVQMPSWMPGAYVYGNFYENVRDVNATSSKGEALLVKHPDKNTWQVAVPKPTKVKITYSIAAGGRMFGQAPDPSFVQISGPATYMYVVGRKKEPCRIFFDVPTGWPVVTGLDAEKGGPNRYKAPTYDVLADNPVSTGDMIVKEYSLRGKNHYIVMEGPAKNQVDQAKLLRDCRFVSAAETDFFGGAPYHKYVWHFTVRPGADGAGGLEHLSSTQISLAAGEGPRAQSVLAHEYFHLWNVKRIRSFPLGPFDYLTLPKTGALWWLEGTTDYYASLIPYRYGEWTRQMFFDSIKRNYEEVANNPAYSEVSANEASLRVADAAGGRGNSNGFKISYYNLGWLGGLCLDTEIRYQTKNRHSLDDVVRALYELCKDNKPGFEEDEIRKQCIRFGGPSLGPFYDTVILKAGQMPIDAQLAKMGVKLAETDKQVANIGFTTGGIRAGNGLRVASVNSAAEGKLMEGDVILGIDGSNLDTDDAATLTKAATQLRTEAQIGQSISLKVKRGSEMLDVQIVPAAATQKTFGVAEDPSAGPSAVTLREGWLKSKTPSVM